MRLKLNALIVALFCAAIIPIFSINASADGEAPEPAFYDLPNCVDTVKVGINFNKSAVEEAAFQREGGSGFVFGYYDITRNFRALSSTSSSSITVCSSGNNGGYYIVLSDVFNDDATANSVAKSIAGYTISDNSGYRVCVGNYSSKEKAEKALAKKGFSGEVRGNTESSFVVKDTNTGNVLYSFNGNDIRKLAIMPAEDSRGVSVYNENAYRGAFEFSSSGSGICVVNYLSLEDYTQGVMPYEMLSYWPAEALKAQAVCARTYAINNINDYSDYGFDVTNDTYSQMYKGITDTNAATDAAAIDTWGQLVRYRGMVCKVYYMAADGGATESGENVFAESRPYLKAVIDDYESSVNTYANGWKEAYNTDRIASKLSVNGYDMGEVTWIEPTYSDAGNVIALTVTDKNGNVITLRNEECYQVFSLDSLRYNITKDTDDGVTFVFTGDGSGHNCGLSQYGACAMAKNFGFNCGGIINFYFTGAYVA